ncbi:MAG: GGDEF domain-containing protein [Pseudomonadota bacterium]
MVWTAAAPSDDDAYLKTRLNAVYSIALSMVWMDLLGSALMTGLFWQAGRSDWLATWITVVTTVILGRMVFVLAYRSGRFPTIPGRVWARVLIAFAIAAGLSWGGALGVMIAGGNDQQIMFTACMVLGGLTLSIANIAYWPVYAAFEIPVMLSSAVGFFFSDRPGHWALSAASVIMGVALLGASRRLADQVLQAHRLAADNQALIDSLGERGKELEMACDALERVSRTDPLTGLANRRSRDARLAEEWGRSLRNGGSLAVVAIDVDHFKKFNDTHGHDQGDRALKAVAAMLEAGIRGPIDLAARQGGEEFMLILPGVDLHAAASIAERVRVMVATCSTNEGFALPEKVTISLGVAAFTPAPGRSVHELTIAADAALYQAKLAGRNRYELATIGPIASAA